MVKSVTAIPKNGTFPLLLEEVNKETYGKFMTTAYLRHNSYCDLHDHVDTLLTVWDTLALFQIYEGGTGVEDEFH